MPLTYPQKGLTMAEEKQQTVTEPNLPSPVINAGADFVSLEDAIAKMAKLQLQKDELAQKNSNLEKELAESNALVDELKNKVAKKEKESDGLQRGNNLMLTQLNLLEQKAKELFGEYDERERNFRGGRNGRNYGSCRGRNDYRNGSGRRCGNWDNNRNGSWSNESCRNTYDYSSGRGSQSGQFRGRSSTKREFYNPGNDSETCSKKNRNDRNDFGDKSGGNDDGDGGFANMGFANSVW